MDKEAAKKYTTEEYYKLLFKAKFAGIVGIKFIPEVIETMRPVMSFEDRPYTDANGNHTIRTVFDSEGNKAYFDATHMDIVEKVIRKKHPNIVWHLAFSIRDVLVAYISETELIVLSPVNPIILEKNAPAQKISSRCGESLST